MELDILWCLVKLTLTLGSGVAKYLKVSSQGKAGLDPIMQV